MVSALKTRTCLMRELLAGEVTLFSMVRRIEQSALPLLPASAAVRAALRLAKSIERYAFMAKANSMTPKSRIMKIGKTRENSTSDCPREPARCRALARSRRACDRVFDVIASYPEIFSAGRKSLLHHKKY